MGAPQAQVPRKCNSRGLGKLEFSHGYILIIIYADQNEFGGLQHLLPEGMHFARKIVYNKIDHRPK